MRLLLCLLRILFLGWVSLIKHYWIILRERRSFQAYRACLTLREAIGAFETTVHSFITNKQARGRRGDHRAFVPEAPPRLVRRRTQNDGDAIVPEVLSDRAE
jgi:hypothetical protein